MPLNELTPPNRAEHISQARAVWDAEADHFDDEADPGLRDETVRNAWATLMEGVLGSGPLSIADLGCGTGSLSHLLYELGHQVTGLDLSPRMLDKPKPTAVKIAKGNPGKHKINGQEPKPAGSLPDCPAHLSAEAKAEWTRIAASLNRIGLLTQVDRSTMAGYCQCYGRWVEAELKPAETPAILRLPSSYIQQSPWLTIGKRCVGPVVSVEGYFGQATLQLSIAGGSLWSTKTSTGWRFPVVGEWRGSRFWMGRPGGGVGRTM